MSSMLRQNHVKIQDLVSYLRGYDPSKPQSAEEWSKSESSGFEPGMLIFCLERVSAPSGLALGKKEAEGESFRVKDLCVVVGRDDNRSLVVNITASAFELRYLEVLLLEKARKAILDGKDFLYVTVKPSQPLDDSKLREIEELGAMYAQGGSRRSLVGEGGGPQEPAVALLAVLGVRLSVGGIGKQVLDIGTVCHMIFAPDGRAEDRNKSLVKSCFTPMPNDAPIGSSQPAQQPAQPPAKFAEHVPQSMEWGPPPTTSWAQDPTPAQPTWNASQPEAAWAQEPPAATDWPAEPPAVASGFPVDHDLMTPPGAPQANQWYQGAPQTPDPVGFAADSSGLNPFAPPADPEADFAAQFAKDLAQGLAGEDAIRQANVESGQEQAMKWGEDAPRPFSQEEYSQKFPPAPELEYPQPTAAPTPNDFGVPQFQKTDFTTSQQFQDFNEAGLVQEPGLAAPAAVNVPQSAEAPWSAEAAPALAGEGAWTAPAQATAWTTNEDRPLQEIAWATPDLATQGPEWQPPAPPAPAAPVEAAWPDNQTLGLQTPEPWNPQPASAQEWTTPAEAASQPSWLPQVDSPSQPSSWLPAAEPQTSWSPHLEPQTWSPQTEPANQPVLTEPVLTEPAPPTWVPTVDPVPSPQSWTPAEPVPSQESWVPEPVPSAEASWTPQPEPVSSSPPTWVPQPEPGPGPESWVPQPEPGPSPESWVAQPEPGPSPESWTPAPAEPGQSWQATPVQAVPMAPAEAVPTQPVNAEPQIWSSAEPQKEGEWTDQAAPVAWGPQGGFSRTTISSELAALTDDVFQPPYEGAEQSDNPNLPEELTQQLDPQNQLFQLPGEPEPGKPMLAATAELPQPAESIQSIAPATIATGDILPVKVQFERSGWAGAAVSEQPEPPITDQPIDNVLSALAGIVPAAPESEDQGPTLFERLNNQLQKGPEETGPVLGPLNPESTHRIELSSEDLQRMSQLSSQGPVESAVPATEQAVPAASDWTNTSADPSSPAAASVHTARDAYADLAEALTGEAANAQPPAAPYLPPGMPAGLAKTETTQRLNLPASAADETLRVDSPFTQESESPKPASMTGSGEQQPALEAPSTPPVVPPVWIPEIQAPTSLPAALEAPQMPPLPSQTEILPTPDQVADEQPAFAAADFSVPAQQVPQATLGVPKPPSVPAASNSPFANPSNFQAFPASDTATLSLDPVTAPPDEAQTQITSQSGDFSTAPSFSMESSKQETFAPDAVVTDGEAVASAPHSVADSEPIAAAEAPPQAVAVDKPIVVPQEIATVAEPAAIEVPPPLVEELEEEIEEEETVMPALSRKSFQEPRLVMNEMATLMSKLEQQVQKAAKKLGSRSEEVRQRLNKQLDALTDEAGDVEKDNQKSIGNLTQKLTKQLDDVSEEVRLKISDVAATGRYTIKQLLTSNQTNVDETKNTQYESLRDACKAFRADTEALVKKSETELNELVRDRTDEMNELVSAISASLDGASDDYNAKLAARFDRFKERMSEEANSVIRALERNVKSMIEEIDGSWDRASEKLKSSRNDFEQTINHTVKTAELNLSNKTRLLLTSSMVPRLVESKTRLRTRASELSKRFSDDSEGQASGQILGLEASLAAARQQLQALVEECMTNLDTVGRGQQAGLEEIFKETSSHAEKATIDVNELLKKVEAEMNENDSACKKLAETSSIDTDPELSEARLETTSRVQQLKQQANTQLTSAIDDGCHKLEQLSHKVQTETSTVWQEQAQSVRDAAENGVTKMRDAIQEAFNAIQAAREKYME